VCGSDDESCTATGFVTLVGNANTVDRVLVITFDNAALSMEWTADSIPHSGNRKSVNRKMQGCHNGYGTAVAGYIVEPHNSPHGFLLPFLRFYRDPVAPFQTSLRMTTDNRPDQ
jgi:hypothetical protein